MPQELQQWQSYCNRCQKYTLHQRILNYPEHILHLLLFLFCCGLWLPIWILITIVAALERQPPFRCTQCGQAAGELTPEQHIAWAQEQAGQQAVVQAHRAEERAESRKVVASRLSSGGAALQSVPGLLYQAGTLVIREAKELPARTDRLLVTIIGEENDILLWFWRIVVIVATVGLLIFLLLCILRLVPWLFG